MQVTGVNDIEWSVIDDIGVPRTVPRSPGNDAWLGSVPMTQPTPATAPIPSLPQSQNYDPEGLAGNLAYGLGYAKKGIGNYISDQQRQIEEGRQQRIGNISQAFQAGQGNIPLPEPTAPAAPLPPKSPELGTEGSQDVNMPQAQQQAGPNMGGILDPYNRAVAQTQQARIEEGKAEAAKSEAQAGALQSGLTDARVQEVEDRKNVEANRKIIDQDFLDIQNSEIDPQKFWHSRNTGQKVAATLGLMIGSVGASFNKGPNYAMDMFNRLVDNDIEAQKANMNKKMNLFRFNYDRFKDEDMAAAASRMQILTYAQRQAEIMGMKANSPLIKAKVMGIVGEMQQQKALTNANFELAMMKANAGNPETTVPGYGNVPHKSLQKPAITELKGYDQALQGLSELRSLRKKYGQETIPGPIKTRMRALSAQIWITLRSGLGQLSKADYDFLDRQIPKNPDEWSWVLDKIDTASKFIENKKTTTLQSYGLAPKTKPISSFGIDPDQRRD